MNRHNFVRPSAIEPISRCAGRPMMEAAVVEMFGEPPTSAVASLGTEVHGYSQQAIELWKRGDEWGTAIATVCNVAALNGIDPWSVRCIQLCAEYVRDLVAKYEIEREHVLTEHHLDMSTYGIERGGTADVLLVKPFKLLVVVDIKAGFLDQGDADEHSQIMVYGVAGAVTFSVPQVLVSLYQPRAEKDRRATIASLDADALRKNAAWIAAVVRRAMADDPELTPGYEQCRHCRALTRCPAFKESMMNAREALELIGSPTTPEDWGLLLSTAKTAERFAETAIEQGKDHLKAGGAATGWQLQPGSLMTKIDPAKAIELAKQNGQLEALLKFASFKTEAAKVIPGLESATSAIPKAASLRPAKAGAAA